VKLPKGEDLNEWLAVNVIDFYNQISIIYGECSHWLDVEWRIFAFLSLSLARSFDVPNFIIIISPSS
jgi:hypothetical protein